MIKKIKLFVCRLLTFFRTIKSLKDEIEKVKSEFSTMNGKISDLNSAILKIQNDISLPTQNEKTTPIPKPIKPEERRQEILFAPAPDKDGSFNVSAVVSSENKTSSFYKFTLSDGQKAKFEFINSERAIIDALNSYEMILKPVCKFKNALNQNAKRIRTTKEGIVIKQNDKWVLDTKAEISYG